MKPKSFESSWLKRNCCFTSTETVGLLGTGSQDGHLDFHTAPELCKSRYNLFFFLPGADAPHVYVHALTLWCFHSLISTHTFRRALTASVDRRIIPLQWRWRNQFWQSLEEGAGKRCSECAQTPKLQALVCDILPSTTAVFSYAIGSRKLSANEQFFVGAQTVVSLLQTTEINQGVSFIAANKVYTSTNKTTIVWIETELYFFTRGGCVSCLRGCLGARLLLQSYWYRTLSEGADRVGRQLRRDEEYPFNGVTISGRVWRKVPESDARSVPKPLTRLSSSLSQRGRTNVHTRDLEYPDTVLRTINVIIFIMLDTYPSEAAASLDGVKRIQKLSHLFWGSPSIKGSHC